MPQSLNIPASLVNVAEPESQPTHLRFLDGFRAAAALLVIFHHAWLQSWPYTIYPSLKASGHIATFTGWLAFGKIAVTAFIVISGFCLMLPIVRYGKQVKPKQFFLRRCRRILVPYYVALVLALLLDYLIIRPHAGTVYDGSFPLTVGGVLSHFFLVQNFSFNPYQIAGPFWSIAVEFQIYLFFPLFVWMYKHYGLPAMLALTTTLGFASSAVFGLIGFHDTFSHYIVMFGFGMCAAHYAFGLKKNEVGRVVRSCYTLIPCFLLGAVGLHHQLGSAKLLTDTLIGLLTASCLTLSTLRPNALLARSFSIKPLVWLGSFSYSLYLVHFTIQQLFWQFVTYPAGWSRLNSFFFISVIGTGVIIIFGYGFFLLFEKPNMGKSKDGRLDAKLAEVAVA